jgi:hypothetical protein
VQYSIAVSRGTSGLDIDLRVVDINQCHANTSSINIFGGTDKCRKETTEVRPVTPAKWLQRRMLGCDPHCFSIVRPAEYFLL